MVVMLVDDEKLALDSVKRCVRQAAPDVGIVTFHCRKTSDYDDVLDFTVTDKPDVVFLDIEMAGGMSGLELAGEIQKLHPHINIIFMTAYSQYSLDAFSIHASGYLVKPPTVEAVERELGNLRYKNNDLDGQRPLPQSSDEPSQSSKKSGLKAKTFGNFNIYYDETPIKFHRQKAREILAYLIDRRGGTVTLSEVAAAVFEDMEYNRPMQKQMQVYIKDMIDALEKEGVKDFVIRSRGELSINPDMISCDYYDFLKKDKAAMESYVGEYMVSYSWGETTNAWLERQVMPE